MTSIYFVRHAESVYVEGKERTRGLTEKGIEHSEVIKDRLISEEIDCFISSPYQRSIQTITPTAEAYLKDIAIVEDLRERSIILFFLISRQGTIGESLYLVMLDLLNGRRRSHLLLHKGY